MSPEVEQAIKDAAISGSASGALLGGFGRMLAGSRKPWELLKSAGIGAGLTGALTAGSTAIGSGLMGAPAPGDSSGYTTRGLVGGLVGGGAIGAGMGALAAHPRLKNLYKLVPNKLKSELPLDNALMDAMKKMSQKGQMAPAASLGGATVGGLGAFLGSDEGMQIDFIQDQLRKRRREEALRNVGLYASS